MSTATTYAAVKAAVKTNALTPNACVDRVFAWFPPKLTTGADNAVPCIVLTRASPNYLEGTEDVEFTVVGRRDTLSTTLALYDALVASVRSIASLVCVSGDRASELFGVDADVVRCVLIVRGCA